MAGQIHWLGPDSPYPEVVALLELINRIETDCIQAVGLALVVGGRWNRAGHPGRRIRSLDL